MADRNSNRGLASADERTRQRVASMGGKAPHEKRGRSGSDSGSKGGESRRGEDSNNGSNNE